MKTIQTTAQPANVGRDTALNQKLREALTAQEKVQLAFIPLILGGTAWHYADDVAEYVRTNRIEQYKSISRKLRALRSEWREYRDTCFNAAEINATEDLTEQFKEAFARDFLILYFTINQAIKKCFPDTPHQEMKTNAYAATLLAKTVNQFQLGHIARVRERTGLELKLYDRYMLALEIFMRNYTGFDSLPDEQGHLETCMKILRNNTERIAAFKIEENGAELVINS